MAYRTANGIFYWRKIREAEAVENGSDKRYRQKDVASHARISRAKLGLIETNKLLPSRAELERIAEYLAVTPGNLYPDEVLRAIIALSSGGGK